MTVLAAGAAFAATSSLPLIETASAQGTNSAPVITFTGVHSVDLDGVIHYDEAENTCQSISSHTVFTATVADPDGDSFTVAIAGDDASEFTLSESDVSGTKTVTFAWTQFCPNFEIPTDRDENNEYEFTLTAIESGLTNNKTTEKSVVVRVTDVDEPPAKRNPPTAVGGVESLRITWERNFEDNDRPPVQRQRLRYKKPIETEWTETRNIAAWVRTATLKSLDSDVEYEVQLRAESAEGLGEWSNSAVAKTLITPLILSFETPAYIVDGVGKRTSVEVKVLLTYTDTTVTIPVSIVNTDSSTDGFSVSGDYTAGTTTNGVLSGTLTFAPGEFEKSIIITAVSDQDRKDERLTISFGALPDPVEEGSVTTALVLVLELEPDIVPRFNDELPSEPTVEERNLVGAAIGQPFEATDPQNDPLTYSISGPDADKFAIDSTTGQIYAAAEFDFELQETLWIAIEASDGLDYEGEQEEEPFSVDDLHSLNVKIGDIVGPDVSVSLSPNSQSSTHVVKSDETITYQITVGNSGVGAARNVQAILTLPYNVIYDSSSLEDDKCVASIVFFDTVVTCELGDIAESFSDTTSFTVNVKTWIESIGPVITYADVRYDLHDEDPTPTDHTAESLIEVVADPNAAPELVLTAEKETETTHVGRVTATTFVATNESDFSAPDVELEIQVPREFSVQSATFGTTQCDVVHPADQSQSNIEISCDLGNLKPREVARIVVVGSPTNRASGQVTLTASVSTRGSEADLSNNVVSTSLTISTEGSVDLLLEAEASSPAVQPGQHVTYTLTVTNRGPSGVSDVRVFNINARNVVPISSVPSDACALAEETTCHIGALAKDESASIVLTFEVPDDATGTFNLFASTDSEGFDYEPGNDHVFVEVIIDDPQARPPWVLGASLTRAEAGANFGRSVAIDGRTFVIGAPREDSERGSIYVFDVPSGSLSSVTSADGVRITPSSRIIGSSFGNSVAIDGDTIVVGAPEHGASGAAFVFSKMGETWAENVSETQLTFTDDALGNLGAERFGWAVAIEGDTVVVGAYQKDKASFVELIDPNTGETILFPAPIIAAGTAFVFTEPAGGWGIDEPAAAQLTASDAATADKFGWSVAVDSGVIVVGAPHHDGAGPPNLFDSGSAYVYVEPENGWVDAEETAILTADDADNGDEFGVAVDVKGSDVVVGAYRDGDGGDASGSVYVFAAPATGWNDATQEAKLIAVDADVGDQFGYSVRFAGDSIVVGTPSSLDLNTNNYLGTGAAYRYIDPGTGWADALFRETLTGDDSEIGDRFGTSVAFELFENEEVLIVGAPGTDARSTDDGTAYVFVGIINQSPAFDDRSSRSYSIETYTATGSAIGDPIQVLDPDGDDPTFSLSGLDAYAFTIDEEGQLRLSAAAKPLANVGRTYRLVLNINDGKDSRGMSSDTIDESILLTVEVLKPPETNILRIEPAITSVTLRSGERVRLATQVYGVQDILQDALADDEDSVRFSWSDDGRGGSFEEFAINESRRNGQHDDRAVIYTAPDTPGEFKVRASIADSRACWPEEPGEDQSDVVERCSAEFTIIVRRLTPNDTTESTPVNPSGPIPSVITDYLGTAYSVFTPAEGGDFIGESFLISAEPGSMPNGEFVGIAMASNGTATNAGAIQQRYTLKGDAYDIDVVDAAGTRLEDYRLNEAAEVCVPLPPALRSNINDVSLTTFNHDGTLTILTSKVKITPDGIDLCGRISTLPATVAAGVEGPPASLPTPTYQPEILTPDTGGTAPDGETALLLMLIGMALATTGIATARRRSAKGT